MTSGGIVANVVIPKLWRYSAPNSNYANNKGTYFDVNTYIKDNFHVVLKSI